MPVSAETLRLLMSKGLAGDDLLEVVEAIDRDHAPTEKPARTGAAERMARYRAQRKANGLATFFDAAGATEKLAGRDGSLCAYCQAAEGDTVDHMTPISQGGTDDLDNLCLACRPCNGRKTGRTPDQAQMPVQSETARAAHVRFVRANSSGEQGEQSPTPPPFSPPIKNSPTPPKKLTPLYPPNPEPSLRSVSPSPSRLGEIFEAEFWPVYPRRIGKAAARKAFDLAIRKGADPAAIVAGARRFAGQRQAEDPSFTPHPATWLNAGRWDDEPDPAHRARPTTGGDLMARLAYPELFNGPDQGVPTHDQPSPFDRGLTGAAAPAEGAARLSRGDAERGGVHRGPTLDLSAEDPDRRRA